MQKKGTTCFGIKFVIACISLFCIIGAVSAEDVSKIIAMVNNEVITSHDFANYIRFLKYKNPELEINDQLREQVLERLIEDKLILFLGKEEIKEVPQHWLNQKIEEMIASYPSQEAFEASLAQEGATVTMIKEKFRVQYRTQHIVEKEVRSKIEITPQEITDYYNKNKLDFVVPRECILWVGKSEEKSGFDELSVLLENKTIEEAFAGEYGVSRLELKESSLKPEIKEVVRDLSKGQYAVKEIEGIFYFVFVEDISPFKIISLEEAKEKIYSFLWEKKYGQAFKDWLESLKENALIKIYE